METQQHRPHTGRGGREGAACNRRGGACPLFPHKLRPGLKAVQLSPRRCPSPGTLTSAIPISQVTCVSMNAFAECQRCSRFPPRRHANGGPDGVLRGPAGDAEGGGHTRSHCPYDASRGRGEAGRRARGCRRRWRNRLVDGFVCPSSLPCVVPPLSPLCVADLPVEELDEYLQNLRRLVGAALPAQSDSASLPSLPSLPAPSPALSGTGRSQMPLLQSEMKRGAGQVGSAPPPPPPARDDAASVSSFDFAGVCGLLVLRALHLFSICFDLCCVCVCSMWHISPRCVLYVVFQLSCGFLCCLSLTGYSVEELLGYKLMLEATMRAAGIPTLPKPSSQGGKGRAPLARPKKPTQLQSPSGVVMHPALQRTLAGVGAQPPAQVCVVLALARRVCACLLALDDFVHNLLSEHYVWLRALSYLFRHADARLCSPPCADPAGGAATEAPRAHAVRLQTACQACRARAH